MKITVYKSEERGGGEFDWLKSKFSFSFGNYFDEKRMGFGALRVLNDDWIAPGSGFPDHSHKDMEIFTIPLSGYLHHEDSTGKKSIITRGDVQIMSAGHGVTHSEFNDSFTEPVTLLQIWITPKTKHLVPRHEERYFPHNVDMNVLHTVITPTGENNTLKIHQDAYVSLGSYDTDTEIAYKLHNEHCGIFLFVIEGEVTLDKTQLQKRDAVEITDTKEISFVAHNNSSLLLIEVPLS